MVLGRVGARASSEVAGGVRGLVYARVRLNPVLVESDRPTWGAELGLGVKLSAVHCEHG